MGNHTYLCTARELQIYPCSSEAGYNSKDHTIATDNWAIPLVWLMLFRESDIIQQDVPTDDRGMTSLRAPVTSTEVAIARLPASLAAFSEAFPGQRSLQPHADMLAEAISSSGRPYVTIELLELEYGISPEHFWPLFRHCLCGFDDPQMTIPDNANPSSWLRSMFQRPKRVNWKDSLSQITTLKFEIEFPPADLLHSRGNYSDDDLWNSSRLLGEALYRPVPWEPPRTR